jgi:hypothetical protein
MRKYILIALAFLFCTYSNAQAVFTLPIEGTYGKDWFIVNHVDEDTTANFIDAFCGTKSYNGHYGTDFVIRNFNQMDAGVNILAPADGQVFVTKDGLFDRNKKSVIANGFGNYIGIKHTINGQNYFTYYAHLKKGSLKVDSGDMVTQGQVIAQVGSSGNSEDPHLHFEVYNDTIVLDPWDAPCQFTPNTTLWVNPPAYDTTFAIINQGAFTQDFIPFLDTIRESGTIQSPSYLGLFWADTSKEYRTVWFLAKGIRKNDTITSKWYHEGSLLSTYNYIADKDYWYFYFWDYIHRDSIPISSYLATETIISLNGKNIFGVELKTTIISVPEIAKQFTIVQTAHGLELTASGNQNINGVEGFTLLGQKTKVQLEQTATNTWLIRRSDATQPLFLQLETDKGIFSHKWMPVY